MFGIDDAIAAVSGLADTAITRIWPDATEVEKAKIQQVSAELEAEYKLLLGQISINKIEAKSESLFKSGWRPFVGWGCGISVLYAGVFEPFLRFIASVVFDYSGTFPSLDTNLTLQILLGMLGLTAARTYEKRTGVHK